MVDNLVDRLDQDAIMIPTGGPTYDHMRAMTAVFKSARIFDNPYYIISGAMGKINKHGQAEFGPNTRIEKTLRDLNIPSEDIIQEYHSRDTLSNIYETSKICEKYGIERLGISSEPSHIKRIKHAYNQLVKFGCVKNDLELIPLEVIQRNIPLKAQLRYFFYNNAAYVKDLFSNPKEIERRYINTKV
ncbi:MAG: YdcF family protein [Candidatus Pacearchaeota archaeon]